jgi:glycosyltransferase involved in cell wall biosynthesis
LAIGYYAPYDMKTLGIFRNRIMSWAYFISLNSINPESVRETSIKILWVGRMLKWKRVDTLINAIALIKDTGSVSKCKIVGEGPEKARLIKLAEKLKLTPGVVEFHSSKPAEEIRAIMRQSDVYVLSSNRKEGWGAVAGEAMTEGVLLIANEQAGAARVLIREGETGFLFKDGDYHQLAKILLNVSANVNLRREIQMRAWKEMNNYWSPLVGARRLNSFIRYKLFHESFDEPIFGPCKRFND